MSDRLAVASILLAALAFILIGPIGAAPQGVAQAAAQQGRHDPTPADLLCATCHDAHNGRSDCTSCHGSMHVPVAADVGCVSCHVVHNGRSDCTSCHSSAVHASVRADVVCGVCHDPHSGRTDCTSCHSALVEHEAAGAQCVSCHIVMHSGGAECETCHEYPHGYGPPDQATFAVLDLSPEPSIPPPDTTSTSKPVADTDVLSAASGEPVGDYLGVETEDRSLAPWAWSVLLAGLIAFVVVRRDWLKRRFASGGKGDSGG